MQAHAGGHQRLQHIGGDVLVVEGHHVARTSEVQHLRHIGVSTHRRGGDDEGCRRVDRLGEDREGETEGLRGADAHASELPSADDADDGEPTPDGAGGPGQMLAMQMLPTRMRA